MKDQLDNINKRIKRRNIQNIGEHFEEKKKKTSIIFSITMTIMILLCFTLGVLIYGKHDEKGSFVQEKFNLKVDFSEINEKIGDLLNQTVVYSLDFFKLAPAATTVGASNFYYQINTNSFINEASVIYAFGNGLISNISEKFMVISYDNLVKIKYLNPLNLKVKIHDRVKEGLIVGDFFEQLEMYFYYQNEMITYETTLSYFN